MKILFVHQNYPGQFRFLGPALVAQGHEVRALHINANDGEYGGVSIHGYKPSRGSTQNIHPWASDFETKVIRGEAAARRLDAMIGHGWTPDVIVGHPGWGEMLFLRNVAPKARQLHFLEFFYQQGLDVGFDPEFPVNGWAGGARVWAKNASGMLNLESMDAAYSPTYWQRASYPSIFHDRISVVHDGIDTSVVVPSTNASLTLAGNPPITIVPGMEVVTFINRNLEPYRGYHSFMRALPAFMQARPEARVVIVGGDGVSYGARPPEGKSWKQIYLDEVHDQIDMSRVHFVGNIRYEAFLALMQITACHVYLTYPFVLSWSMLEAMACGAPVIGSRTPPVQEVLEDGQNGLLVDFLDIDGIADRMAHVVANQEAYREMRVRARATVVDRYDLHTQCLPKQVNLVESLLLK